MNDLLQYLSCSNGNIFLTSRTPKCQTYLNLFLYRFLDRFGAATPRWRPQGFCKRLWLDARARDSWERSFCARRPPHRKSAAASELARFIVVNRRFAALSRIPPHAEQSFFH